MTDTADYCKHMEDSVIEWDFANRIEYCAHRIGQTTRHQPTHTNDWHFLYQRNYGKHNQPAHEQIHQRGYQAIAPGKKYLKSDARNRHTPGNTEDSPADKALQNDQHKGGVGTCN